MLLFGQYRFDSERLVLYCGQREIALRPKVAQLLAYFVARPNELVKREVVLKDLWQHGEFREAALNQSITELRQALGDSAKHPLFIKTIPQQGYMWICDVKVTPCLRKRNRFLIGIALGVALSLGSMVYLYNNSPFAHSQLQAQPQLIIHSMQNHTGVQANAWWGYALEGVLRSRLQQGYQLLPKSRTPDYIDSVTKEAPQQFYLSLKPLQQRFLLQAELAGRRTEVIVEQLDDNFSDIATQLITSLTDSSGFVADQPLAVNGLSDYYRGVQALTEHGPQLAEQYFEAALIQAPEHVPSRLELAQIAWLQGDVSEAKAHFSLIELSPTSPALRARYYLYLGTFEKALGEFDNAKHSAQLALRAAQKSQQIELIASAYQLIADAAWSTTQWQDYTHAMSAAYALIGSRSFAYSEAQRSFYLANPPAAGPQQKNTLNLAQSKEVLEVATRYYRQTERQIDLARSLFAYGQNYLVPVSESENSLLEALEIASSSGDKYFEVQVLTYLGFYYIQLHRGDEALSYLNQVDIDDAFIPAIEQLSVLKAMAYMDIGLTTNNHQSLQEADRRLTQLLANEKTSAMTHANAQLLLAWVALKQGDVDNAESLTQSAFQAYKLSGLDDAIVYAKYTQMYIYLLRNKPDQALDLIDFEQDKEAHLMLFYASVAAHMTQDDVLLKQSKRMLGELQNSQLLLEQLGQLTQQPQRSIELITEILDAPYSVYCQSKWILE
ncbi:winged helix-turn-helix domain-containing protein [Pseudoalteromonas luteoviolacea]|uniref:OmpR/PhoB-type domain-containing protein n=1 Tax=Pseudoalteromonas luteoviolacea S4060-1 TaxID=1365257 RepID=A0A167J2D3_9GAMM|nr:winged helix-turn-helix domain-containing protein [Pseudoalteromonas luteoviolacea]KZN60425.1 hypothetical protein N478_07650 [Pseudoalteromonas luteoviolacea S4060-1]